MPAGLLAGAERSGAAFQDPSSTASSSVWRSREFVAGSNDHSPDAGTRENRESGSVQSSCLVCVTQCCSRVAPNVARWCVVHARAPNPFAISMIIDNDRVCGEQLRRFPDFLLARGHHRGAGRSGDNFISFRKTESIRPCVYLRFDRSKGGRIN